jgi:hypothetical protein
MRALPLTGVRCHTRSPTWAAMICFSEDEAWALVWALDDASVEARDREALAASAWFYGLYRLVRDRIEEGGVP